MYASKASRSEGPTENAPYPRCQAKPANPGVWVFNQDGKHLGTIKPTEVPANVGWAEEEGVLWMTARTSVYRIKLK